MIGTLNLTNRDYWLCYEFDLDEITLEQRIVVKMTDLDFWGRVQSGYYQAKFLKFDYKDCEVEFGFADFPEEVKNFIHGKAYEEGHAYGFSEIANKYDDLVEFVNVCKEAFTNA